MVREKLLQLPMEICPVLNVSIMAGVAYHHAGMTLEEREIIENAFRKRTIDILTATSTLSAGVNLPAYRVIFRSPYIGPKFLTTAKYRQMSGRAGRAGIDNKGESIIVASVSDKMRVFELINSQMKPLESRLNFENDGVRRIILESVASKVARTKRDMSRFLKSTFLCVSQPQPDAAAVKAALGFLTEKKFVEKTKAFAAPPGQGPRRSLLDTPTALLCREERKAKKALLQSLWEEKRRQPLESVYFATQLGDATFFSGLSPSEALFMKDIYGSLSLAFRETAERVGLSETYLSRCAYAPPPYRCAAPETHLHRRFFLALLLYELVCERPAADVARRFGVARGKLQALQSAAASFARMAALFCRRLNWSAAACLLAHFGERAGAGAHGELVPLLRVAGLRPFRARALFDAGLTDARRVAAAAEGEVCAALARCRAFSAAEGSRRWGERALREEARAVLRAASEVVAEEVQRAERVEKEVESRRECGVESRRVYIK